MTVDRFKLGIHHVSGEGPAVKLPWQLMIWKTLSSRVCWAKRCRSTQVTPMLVIKKSRVAPCSQIQQQTLPGMSSDPNVFQWTVSITWTPNQCSWRPTASNSTLSREIGCGHGMKTRGGRYSRRRGIYMVKLLRGLWQVQLKKLTNSERKNLNIKVVRWLRVAIETAETANLSRATNWSNRMSCQTILIQRSLLFLMASLYTHYFPKRTNQAYKITFRMERWAPVVEPQVSATKGKIKR